MATRTVDLGSVVGPQGPAGPNEITSATETDLTGVLMGDGSNVGVKPVDATPTQNSTNLVQSGGVASAVSAVQNTVSRRNLLDNWYFVGGGSQQGGGQFPINQRGQTSYSGTGYGIDRWKTARSEFGQELQADCLRWKCNTAISGGNIIYAYFYPTTPLQAGTYTLSFLVKGLDGGGTWFFSSGSGGYSIGNIAMSVGLVSRTFVATGSEASPSFYLWHQGALAVNGYLDIIAAKLELGSTQTLAHQENGVWVLNEIPSFAEELLKCQLYFYRYNGLTTAGALSGLNVTACTIPFPVTMRAVPTISNITYYDSKVADGNGAYVSGVRFYNSNSVSFSVTGFYASADL